MSADSTRPHATVNLSLDDQSLDRLAARVVEQLASLLTTSATPAAWLDSKAAATYLGLPSVHPLHKLTARREIAFSQDSTGGKCWFRVADLDCYRLRGRIEARDSR